MVPERYHCGPRRAYSKLSVGKITCSWASLRFRSLGAKLEMIREDQDWAPKLCEIKQAFLITQVAMHVIKRISSLHKVCELTRKHAETSCYRGR